MPNSGKLNPSASESLLGHYRELEKVVDAALTYTLSCPTATLDSRGRIPDYVHSLADHAKYVYAIGTRDIAAMQYKLAELAGTGRLDHEVQNGLQWDHCLPMWETLYDGTTCAVRDDRTWDGGWDWSNNTYSDGRQVMAQARVKNWYQLVRNWPYNEFLCGDGPIREYPRGRSPRFTRSSTRPRTARTTRRSRSTSTTLSSRQPPATSSSTPRPRRRWMPTCSSCPTSWRTKRTSRRDPLYR